MFSKTMKKKWIMYGIFSIIYLILFIYGLTNKTQWALDAVFTFLIVSLIFFSSKKLKITPEGFLLINLAFMLHNFGTFGFYAKSFGPFGYDNLVHFFSATAAAYVSFNFISRRLHIKKGKKIEKTVVDEHKIILILLVIATVAMLGVIIELIEFGGFLYLGEGEGLFFVGVRDSTPGGDILSGQYIDTMSDIIVNTFGSILGVIAFYFLRYKKKYWIRYN